MSNSFHIDSQNIAFPSEYHQIILTCIHKLFVMKQKKKKVVYDKKMENELNYNKFVNKNMVTRV